MGNYISWEIPSSETTWTDTKIERATQQAGPFSEIASQLIANNTYYDPSGTSSHYYKIRFYDSVNLIYSTYSSVFQADKEYYCTARDIADFLGMDNYTDSTNPTRFQVESIISRVCDGIDADTRHAWRKTRITDEYYDIQIGNRTILWDATDRLRLYITHRAIRSPLIKLECFDGKSWIDFVASYTEGRDKDFWVDYTQGIVHFANRYPLRTRQSIRLTYDFGETEVDGSIKTCAILQTCMSLVQKQDLNIIYPQGGLISPIMERYKLWKEEADSILEYSRELFINKSF